MTAKEAGQILTQIFLRFPGQGIDAETRKGIIAVWGTELMLWFSGNEAQDVMRWAQAACREYASQFLPALDPLIESMLAERMRESLPRSSLRLEAPKDDEAPVSREEAKRILGALAQKYERH